MSSRPVEALVLSGGASSAAYEVGVALALFSGQSPATSFMPLQPLVLSGSSAGAFNAAVLVSAPDADFVAAGRRLEQIWLQRIAHRPGTCDTGIYRLRDGSLSDPDCLSQQPLKTLSTAVQDTAFLARDFLSRAVQFVASDAPVPRRLADLLEIGVFISPEPLRQLIRSTISFERVRNATLRLRIASTNWRTGELRTFTNPDFSDEIGDRLIAASAAVPGIFPPVDIRGEYYVDGGIFMNTPLKAAIDAGADLLHVVYVEPQVAQIPFNRFQGTLEAIIRTLSVANAANIAADLETARRVNSSLAVIEKLARGQPPAALEVRDFVRAAGQVYNQVVKSKRPRQLTIHRYHPRDVLGGPYGLVNFDISAIRQMIERGYADTRRHDCVASGCIVPDLR